jgi:WD40 repeat protein
VNEESYTRAGKAADKGLRPDARKGVSSPDRKVIAAADRQFIRLLDAQTGKEIRRFAGHTDTVTALAFSPDGKLLASGSKDRSASLWDIVSGKQFLKFQAQHPVESVAFSPDGRTLVIGNNGQTSELDIPSGRLIRVNKQ